MTTTPPADTRQQAVETAVRAVLAEYRVAGFGDIVAETAAAALASSPAGLPQDEGGADAFVEVDCKVGHRILIDDGDGGTYVCPLCALQAKPAGLPRDLRVELSESVDRLIASEEADPPRNEYARGLLHGTVNAFHEVVQRIDDEKGPAGLPPAPEPTQEDDDLWLWDCGHSAVEAGADYITVTVRDVALEPDMARLLASTLLAATDVTEGRQP